MFRKPKRTVKDALRKKSDDDVETSKTKPAVNGDKDDEDGETSELLVEARQRGRASTSGTKRPTAEKSKEAVMHTYDVKQPVARDLVTSTAEHHPHNQGNAAAAPPAAAADGIFRGDRGRNKFHAGPLRAAGHVRVTARFDYQPDVCKDYKETGFCGFGDTCIYLHDRGDTVSGWQLEQQWEEQQKAKKAKQEREMNDFATGTATTAAGASSDHRTTIDDGIPFACHLCRGAFKEPVGTNCLHYFCQVCIMNHVRTLSDLCPVCGKDTGSVFNFPVKLIAKKRKVLGAALANDVDSWALYLASFAQGESSVAA